MKFLILFLSVLFGIAFSAPDISSERSRNLKNLETTPLLFHYHNMTNASERQKFYYPRRDSAWRRNFKAIEKDALFLYQNSRMAFAASAIFGVDIRGGEALKDTIFPGIDGGLYLRGFIDSLEFALDARMYVENHSADYPRSFDGEFVEFQKEENNSGVEYASYSRYRGSLSLNAGFARFNLARDVFHFGPGYYNNLTLNQFALPYNTFSMELEVGPLSVLSFYGDLRIHSNSMNIENTNSRNLYGHRYELNFGNLVLGMSEIQVIYDNNNVWLFVPIVPLFIEKGNFSEDSNNGALAFDFSYRFLDMFRVYSEYFLDDMESPVSLIKNDNAEAKWAWMAGAQVAKDFVIKNHKIQSGMLAEYARVEPFVYTHFKKNTAQLAHLGRPIGNPNGPNSQTIDWLIYAQINSRVNVSLRQTWLWKGTDYGSALNDTTPDSHYKYPKSFLDGAEMKYSITPAVSYSGQFVYFMMEWTFIDDKKIYTRLGFKW